jgi:hypothetical protein
VSNSMTGRRGFPHTTRASCTSPRLRAFSCISFISAF